MTNQDVTNLVREYHVPAHVWRHCKTVASFATKLAKEMSERGIKIDVELVRNAALLHDLVRVVDFKEFDPKSWDASEVDVKFWKKLRKDYKGMHHARAAEIILKERGFLNEARVIGKHMYVQIEKGFQSWEEKLVYYADKRAKHDTIVSLRERLEDGRARNAPHNKNNERTKMLDAKITLLEKEIVDVIGHA